jgi:hypothetical protein
VKVINSKSYNSIQERWRFVDGEVIFDIMAIKDSVVAYLLPWIPVSFPGSGQSVILVELKSAAAGKRTGRSTQEPS